MADNITLPGSGQVVRTVEIGGIDHQVVIWTNEAGAYVAKLEDTAHTTGDPGIMALAVRNDTATVLAGTAGDYIPLSTDSIGRLMVADSSVPAVTLSGGTTGITSHVSSNFSIHTSAARTSTPTAIEQTNDYARGVVINLHVTAFTSSPSLVVTIAHKDDLSNAWATPVLLTGTAITSAQLSSLPAHFTYCVYPAAVASTSFTTGVIAPLPRTWRVVVTHGTGTPDGATYTVQGAYLL